MSFGDSSITCTGYYFLIFRLEKNVDIQVGSLGTLSLKAGVYGYIGSSFLRKGIAQRVARHLSRNKKIRWHIDYLTSKDFFNPIELIWICSQSRGKEYEASKCIESAAEEVVEKFGSSDSKARGHLFLISENAGEYFRLEEIVNCFEKRLGKVQQLIL
ncbi:MAG: GIY-YIG nuclease family protein [Fervidicoccaceae archaeon]